MMINEAVNITGANYTTGSIQVNNAAKTNNGFVVAGATNIQSKNEISSQNAKLKEACTQFEQIFIKYMVDKMWSGTEAAEGKQTIEKSVWQDYFNNEISKVIAESNMTGISETLYGQLGALESAEQEAIPAREDVEAEAETADAGNGEIIA
jgi:Rod binding domain-containing protein